MKFKMICELREPCLKLTKDNDDSKYNNNEIP